MDTRNLIRDAWELVPILLLFLVGGATALRSGVRGLASRQDLRQIIGNLWLILLRLLGYIAAILVVHEWIGVRPGLGW
jgi:hypothetical protein